MVAYKVLFFCFCLFLFEEETLCKVKEKNKEENKINKKLTDYTDADLEKLLDQWNENDDEYEEDPEDKPWLKPKPEVNVDEIFKAGGDKEKIMQITKKGQPLMIFVNVAGNPSKHETEEISALWQTSLRNNQIQAQRYVIADDRVLFQLEDGSQAIEIKDYLISLDTCANVSFEGMDFPGKGSKQKNEL